MTIGWNILGILAWLVIVLYLVFIIQNIRKRHIMMIVKDRKRFKWSTTLLDALEVIIFLGAVISMSFLTFFSHPDLQNKSLIDSKVEYESLILSTGKKGSYYVTATSSNNTAPRQSYRWYSNGTKMTVNSNYASISDGANPLSVAASAIPYSEKELKKADSHYQNAYVAVYTATYKRTWYNGLGLHAGRTATQYYLIRVPDQTFVRQVKK